MSTTRRSVNTPKHFTNANGAASDTFSKTFVGFVKGNTDPLKMGRLQVWIPELSSDPEVGTYWCNYMSPFAGASNADSTSSSSIDGQTSYGWWSVPPDIDNEVVVMFINGDPNRGIWIGCLYHQYMNHMVPGIPTTSLINTDSSKPSNGPATEYNKKDPKQNTSTDPNRPAFKSLQDALTRQGLYYDNVRGQSTSGARRDTQSKVMGLLSPYGNQFVIDDDPDNSFIRFRTRNGAQLVINDNIGNIYMISKNGNSWVEISDTGIDFYTNGDLSMRSQSDLNFHADGRVNITAVKSINLNSAGAINVGAGNSINTVAGNQFNVNSNGSLNLVTGAALNIAAGGDLGINSGGQLALQSYDSLGVTSCGTISLMATKINQNTSRGPTPAKAVTASSIALTATSDRELSPSEGYPEISTKTNNSRLPTHEPYSGHPTSSTGAVSTGINQKVSTRVEQGDSGVQPGNKSSDIPADATDDQANTTPSANPGDWWIPTTGRISAPYGDTDGGVHKNGHPGCDIAAPMGSNIMASRAGKILWAAMGVSGSGYGGYGNCVCIDHLDGYHSIYGHMSAINVSNGDTVIQGQSIGRVGSTGMSTGNHCHFELRKSGTKVDPASFIPSLGTKNNHVVAGNPNPTKATKSNPST